jgi:uncharacterized phage protein (TIGR01671 family)
MREMLFRGKEIDTKQWINGSLITEGPLGEFVRIFPYSLYLTESLTQFHYVIPETVGQYTGLTDKNGREIFEGDIVKNEYSKGQYQYFKVIYDERIYRWETENKYGMLGQLCNVMGECEVIGNIHDNPELLGNI